MEDSSHTDDEDTSIFDSHEEYEDVWQNGDHEEESPFKPLVEDGDGVEPEQSEDYALRHQEEPSGWESIKNTAKANKGTAIGIAALLFAMPIYWGVQQFTSDDAKPKSSAASSPKRQASPIALNSSQPPSTPAASTTPPPSQSNQPPSPPPPPSSSTTQSEQTSTSQTQQAQSPALITPLKVDPAHPESCPSPDGSADLALDGKLETAWVCQMRFNRNGQILDIALPGKYVVTQVCIDPGYDKRGSDGTDEWLRHRIVTTVVYDFGDGHRVTLNTGSNRGLTCQDVPSYTTSRIEVVVKQTAVPQDQGGSGGYSPQGDKQDFAISEIQATGYPVE